MTSSPDEFRPQIYFRDLVTVAQHHLPFDPNMARKKGAILEPLLAKAIGLSADQLEVEYKDGSEEVFAMKSGVGVGIASFRSSSPEAKSLRNELYALAKKRQRAKIDEHTYELRARIFDSFGEDAFRVELRRL